MFHSSGVTWKEKKKRKGEKEKGKGERREGRNEGEKERKTRPHFSDSKDSP
jgi:hypothetical protein